MQNKSKLRGYKIGVSALNIVILVLCVVLVIMLALVIESVHSSFFWHADEDTFYYAIKNEEYANMVEYYHRNVQTGYEENAEMKEYYGVTKYFEAACLYKAYGEAGNTEQADRYLERMAAALEEMGDLVIAREPIHAQLGLE